jgi:hypothetical protein
MIPTRRDFIADFVADVVQNLRDGPPRPMTHARIDVSAGRSRPPLHESIKSRRCETVNATWRPLGPDSLPDGLPSNIVLRSLKSASRSENGVAVFIDHATRPPAASDADYCSPPEGSGHVLL